MVHKIGSLGEQWEFSGSRYAQVVHTQFQLLTPRIVELSDIQKALTSMAIVFVWHSLILILIWWFW